MKLDAKTDKIAATKPTRRDIDGLEKPSTN